MRSAECCVCGQKAKAKAFVQICNLSPSLFLLSSSHLLLTFHTYSLPIGLQRSSFFFLGLAFLLIKIPPSSIAQRNQLNLICLLLVLLRFFILLFFLIISRILQTKSRLGTKHLVISRAFAARAEYF